MNFEESCRLCLEKSNDLFELFDSNHNWLLSIEEFTGLKIMKEEGLPQHICNSCKTTIETLNKFKTTCLASESILRQQDTVKIVVLIEEATEQDESSDTQEQQNISTRKCSKIKKKRQKDDLHSCYICGKLYNRSNMKYHLNQHYDKRPYACTQEDCDKSFPSPSQLLSHCRNCHTDKYSFQCDVCGKQFKVKTTYDIHRSYHFEPQIPCSICGKLLRHPRAVKIHMMTHTGERPFKCTVCQKSFQNRYTLRIHQRVHTKEKPFACSKCDKSFGYNCLLKSHAEKCHPESIDEQ